MGDTQQEPDPGHGESEEGAWHPPNQNAAIMAEATPAVVSRSQNGTAFVEAGHLGQGYVAVTGQFDGATYQELRPSFSGEGCRDDLLPKLGGGEEEKETKTSSKDYAAMSIHSYRLMNTIHLQSLVNTLIFPYCNFTN